MLRPVSYSFAPIDHCGHKDCLCCFCRGHLPSSEVILDWLLSIRINPESREENNGAISLTISQVSAMYDPDEISTLPLANMDQYLFLEALPSGASQHTKHLQQSKVRSHVAAIAHRKAMFKRNALDNAQRIPKSGKHPRQLRLLLPQILHRDLGRTGIDPFGHFSVQLDYRAQAQVAHRKYRLRINLAPTG
jgi:hypothetical protein